MIQQVSTEKEREAFAEQLMAAEDWLYGDGEAEGAATFVDRLSALKVVGEPISRRAAELELRPTVLATLQEKITTAAAIVAGWAEGKPWITAEETTAASDKLSDFASWLDAQQKAQEGRLLTQDPAFTCLELLEKWEAVQKAVSKTDAKRKPRPPPPQPAAGGKAKAPPAADGSGGDVPDGEASPEDGGQAEGVEGVEGVEGASRTESEGEGDAADVAADADAADAAGGAAGPGDSSSASGDDVENDAAAPAHDEL
jgi:hypothetical protein